MNYKTDCKTAALFYLRARKSTIDELAHTLAMLPEYQHKSTAKAGQPNSKKIAHEVGCGWVRVRCALDLEYATQRNEEKRKYDNTPIAKARRKRYRKEYNSRPEVRDRQRQFQRHYYEREVIDKQEQRLDAIVSAYLEYLRSNP